MRLALAPHVEAAIGEVAAAAGLSPQEWVRSVVAIQLGLVVVGGGGTKETPTDTKETPTDTKATPAIQSYSYQESYPDRTGGGDTKETPTDTKETPTDTAPTLEEIEMAAWKPRPGATLMPYDAFMAAVKVIYHDAEVAPPKPKQINSWASALQQTEVVGSGRWELVRLLTDLFNRGALKNGEGYVWRAVTNQAARVRAELREALAFDIEMGGDLVVQ